MTRRKVLKPSRGEVWEVDWFPRRRTGQVRRRQVLILQTGHGNHSDVYGNTITTMSPNGRQIPFHIFVRKTKTNGLKADSYVKCEQFLTISKLRPRREAWGRLTDDHMGQIRQAVKLSLWLTS